MNGNGCEPIYGSGLPTGHLQSGSVSANGISGRSRRRVLPDRAIDDAWRIWAECVERAPSLGYASASMLARIAECGPTGAAIRVHGHHVPRWRGFPAEYWRLERVVADAPTRRAVALAHYGAAAGVTMETRARLLGLSATAYARVLSVLRREARVFL